MSSTSIQNTGLLHPMEVFMRAPNFTNVSILASSVGNILTPPTGCPLVRLAGSVDFSARFGDTLATNALTTLTTGGGSEFCSAQSGGLFRHIGGSTVLSVISTVAGAVTASWWTM